MPNGIGSRIKTGPSQTGQLPGRIKSELCDLRGLRIDLISRLLSLSRLYSGILHSLSLSLSTYRRNGCLRTCRPGASHKDAWPGGRSTRVGTDPKSLSQSSSKEHSTTAREQHGSGNMSE